MSRGAETPEWWIVAFALLSATMAAMWGDFGGPSPVIDLTPAGAFAMTFAAVGLSGWIGGLAAAAVSKTIRDEPSDPKGQWTGLVERVAFTAVAFFDPGVALAGALPWLALKIAANWEPRTSEKPRLQAALAKHRTASLLGGVTSLMFAIAGGAVVHFVLGL